MLNNLLDFKSKRDRDDFFIALAVVIFFISLFGFGFLRGDKVNLNVAEASLIPAVVETLPDTDGDGVFDENDKCPEVAGVVENDGCPIDRDGDGVADEKDKCPRTAGPIANNGCPFDKDKDGVPDNKDNCPDLAWDSPTGCPPDTDGDGVYDPNDKCPKEAGSKLNDGCPMITKEEKAYLQEIRDIQFATGTSNLERASTRRLIGLKDILEKRAQASVLIYGYTDNAGDPQKNMDLSFARAEACKKFLIDSGIDASRIIAKGFGETRPLPGVDQATEEGKRANRRVEFKLKY